MSILEKTRKILWGRSGNRCAICKKVLVVDETSLDEHSVVGDECHIISSRPAGPRHDPAYPCDKLDAYGNLILLCRVHHKMIDDQLSTHTQTFLLQAKAKHESWVSEKLNNDPDLPNPRLQRTKQGTPERLVRLTTGKQILNLVAGACSYSIDYDEPTNRIEIDLVSGFVQAIDDSDILEASDEVEAAFSFTQTLKELDEAGFFVFGGREVRILEGGPGGPCNWPIAIVRVLRKGNPIIVELTGS